MRDAAYATELTGAHSLTALTVSSLYDRWANDLKVRTTGPLPSVCAHPSHGLA
jgi:hypothetical protein